MSVEDRMTSTLQVITRPWPQSLLAARALSVNRYPGWVVGGAARWQIDVALVTLIACLWRNIVLLSGSHTKVLLLRYKAKQRCHVALEHPLPQRESSYKWKRLSPESQQYGDWPWASSIKGRTIRTTPHFKWLFADNSELALDCAGVHNTLLYVCTV